MALSALLVKFSDLRKRSRPDACAPAEPQEERKTMTIPPPRPRRRKPLDAGPFAPEIGSFRLHLAAEGKAGQDRADLYRGRGLVRRRPPDPPHRVHQVGAGQRA
jgi:hypothetical protein